MTSKQAGIWIDHDMAVIVTLDEAVQPVAVIESHAAKHPERAELNGYYDRVIVAVSDLSSLLIMGPGEAKSEFAKRLEHAHLSDRVVGLETVDKMTDMQMTAKVHKFFSGRLRNSR